MRIFLNFNQILKDLDKNLELMWKHYCEIYLKYDKYYKSNFEILYIKNYF